MGAFHEGHLSIMRRAWGECSTAAVSIFVNPKQFGPSEDYEKYPRDLEADLDRAAETGVDAVFAPEAAEMYPPDSQTLVMPGGLATGLCGPFRPGHFVGVATVVGKLFNIMTPERAYFGEKDFQQLRIIEQMVADLNYPIAIARCPTAREEDGLAMSSRNVYLSHEQRGAAALIPQAIANAQAFVASGRTEAQYVELAARQLLHTSPHIQTIEYVSVVDDERLQRIATVEGEARIAVAVRIGPTRLIDNGPLTPPA